MKREFHTEIQPAWKGNIPIRYHWYVMDQYGEEYDSGYEIQWHRAEEMAEDALKKVREQHAEID